MGYLSTTIFFSIITCLVSLSLLYAAILGPLITALFFIPFFFITRKTPLFSKWRIRDFFGVLFGSSLLGFGLVAPVFRVWTHSTLNLLFVAGPVIAFVLFYLVNGVMVFRERKLSIRTKTLIIAVALLIGEVPLFLLLKSPCGLSAVADEGHKYLFKVMLMMGMDPDGPGCDRPPIVAAARDLTMINDLIAKGADVNRRARWGWIAGPETTALHEARGRKRHLITKALLEVGANVHGTNRVGATALFVAAELGDNESVLLLIKAGSDVNARNEWGNTPLFPAVYKGHAETVRLLLNAGGEVNVTNEYDKTPLAMAEAAKNQEIVRILKEAGAVR